MFKSSERLRHEAAQRSLDRVASTWRSSRTTWFDGTPESIEMRLAATDRLLAVARSGFTPAHLELTVEAENARKELLAAKHQLLEDFLDDSARAFKGSKRVAAVDPFDPESDEYTSDTGWKTFNIPGDSFNDKHDWMMKQLGRSPEEAQEARDAHYREARAPQENENWEEGATYADYNGKCTKCKSDNIDAAGHGTGEYDCYDCGATFHPKVRKLKSSVHTAGEEYDGLDELSRYLGDRLLNPQQYVRTYRDEDGPGLPGGLPQNLRHHLNHPDPVQGAYNAGYEASGGNGEASPYLDHEDPWDAAGTDWNRAGGQHGDAFNDGWLDYASEIPHRYNSAADHAEHPEGYFGGGQ